MRAKTSGFLLAALSCGGLACRPATTPRVSLPLPPAAGQDAPDLPPLPEISPRTASYTIEARLDPEAHTLSGSLLLEWRNTSAQSLASFPFHLYWNAYRNTLSTYARGDDRSVRDDATAETRRFGWIQVRSVQLDEEDVTPTLRYLNEDGNTNDRTVIEVQTAQPVPPGATARFRIEWEALVPHGTSGRAGWAHDYHFIAQWFPKIGVFWKGAWNCHPFYRWTEFFADFGVYDVRLTLPRGFVVGATGRLQDERDNADGTRTWHFIQEDVHDFAWTASRRFLERWARFDDAGYPPVDIRLLVQPEHARLAERYLEATKIALRTFGTWSAPYPYPQITVVDPAWGSLSHSMEYPTLFTGRASIFAPPASWRPEAVTIHEAGHQFWYGLVANNEFEEAWLDEGFTVYMEAKTNEATLPPRGSERWFFAVDFGRRLRAGWPVVAPGVSIPRGSDRRASLHTRGTADPMTKDAWTYRDRDTYVLNSYGKPALVLQTLEGLLGEETMVKVLRTYARRYRFAHPTTADFMATVDEVTGEDWRWFFEETFFSSDLCDYAVEVQSRPALGPRGYFESPDGRPLLKDDAAAEPRQHRNAVTVVRMGGVRMPVELRVEFADGTHALERWDGRDRWRRFEYAGPAVVHALVDPDRKIAIDVDPVNNEWIASEGPARRSATKWAARFLLWLQTLLEMQAAVG